jgi:hypothetical protein
MLHRGFVCVLFIFICLHAAFSAIATHVKLLLSVFDAKRSKMRKPQHFAEVEDEKPNENAICTNDAHSLFLHDILFGQQ